MKIDKNVATPLHIQLQELLKTQVLKGNLKPGGPIASERELCRLYNVSQITVRQAVGALEQQGILRRIPRKGTYVAEAQPPPHFSLSIGLLLPASLDTAKNSFILQLAAGIKNILQKRNTFLALLYENEPISQELFRSKSIEAMIVTNPRVNDTRIKEFQKWRLPFVVIGRPATKGLHYVDNDNIEIGRIMTRHLLEYGFEKPAFLGFDKSCTVTSDRLAGYKEELRDKGFQSIRNLISTDAVYSKTTQSEARKLLSAGADSIVCEDDLIALEVLNIIEEQDGRAKGIGVIGCNNSFFTNHTIPSISSVEIFPELLGARAAEKLLALMDRKVCEFKTIVPCELHVRASSTF